MVNFCQNRLLVRDVSFTASTSLPHDPNRLRRDLENRYGIWNPSSSTRALWDARCTLCTPFASMTSIHTFYNTGRCCLVGGGSTTSPTLIDLCLCSHSPTIDQNTISSTRLSRTIGRCEDRPLFHKARATAAEAAVGLHSRYYPAMPLRAAFSQPVNTNVPFTALISPVDLLLQYSDSIFQSIIRLRRNQNRWVGFSEFR